MTRNIGISVEPPKTECNDHLCPFHGTLSVRGKITEGKIVSSKAPKMVVIQREHPKMIVKFKRYARSQSKIHAYKPSCIDVKEGDRVMTAECKPISKSISFVVLEVLS